MCVMFQKQGKGLVRGVCIEGRRWGGRWIGLGGWGAGAGKELCMGG